jgi:ribosomal protein S18 acetylase RimI-like enzyme
MAITIRPLAPRDQGLLWDLLHIALWDPPPAPLRPRELLQHPDVRIYAESWGGKDDVGVVAEVDGKPAGAAWMRVIPDGLGMAHVDDDTPQLGIALLPEFQRRGIGERLLRAALGAAKAHGFAQVSLTVHPRNPAIALYERCGFRQVADRTTFHLMVATLQS